MDYVRQKLAEATVEKTVSLGGVFAFDPGKATGVVFVDYGGLSSASTFSFEELSDWLTNWELEYDLVILEEFRLYPGVLHRLAFDKADAAKATGVIDAKFKDKVVRQSASDIKGRDYAPETKLLLAGYTGPALTRHEKDALAHVITYARRQMKKS